MKKMLFLSLLILGLVFVTTPLMAVPFDTLVLDKDPIDENSTYWEGSDQNPSTKGQLKGSSETTEMAWANAIIGYGTLTSYTKVEAGLPLVGNAINAYNPGFAWDYVVVKYANYWALYADEGDDLLNTPAFSIPGATGLGVSHVTFFNPTTQVPEPTSLLLLGLSLVGVVGVRRMLKK